MISTEDVGRLRQETGAGVMACKQALEQAGGDFEKAKKVLRRDAQAIAQKKAERASEQGVIEVYVHGDKIGVLLEISAESDFVAKNEQFKKLAHEIAMQIASMNPKDIEELKNQVYIRDESLKIQDLLERAIAKMGENIQLKRFVRFELGEE